MNRCQCEHAAHGNNGCDKKYNIKSSQTMYGKYNLCPSCAEWHRFYAANASSVHDHTTHPYVVAGSELFQIQVEPLPTFILNSNIQGIISPEHAAEIAAKMVNHRCCMEYGSKLFIGVMSYTTGQAINVRLKLVDAHTNKWEVID